MAMAHCVSFSGLIVVAVFISGLSGSSVKITLNPDANEECQGKKFPECDKLTSHITECDANTSSVDPVVQCVRDAYKDLKLLDCNDYQRKGAKRFVKIYEFFEGVACNITSEKTWKDFNDTEKETCWNGIRANSLGEIFGYGTLGCKIPRSLEQNCIENIKKSCKESEEYNKYFYELLEFGDCVIAGSICLTKNPILLAMTSVLVLMYYLIR